MEHYLKLLFKEVIRIAYVVTELGELILNFFLLFFVRSFEFTPMKHIRDFFILLALESWLVIEDLYEKLLDIKVLSLPDHRLHFILSEGSIEKEVNVVSAKSWL